MREEGKGKTKHLGCDCKGYCHLIELMYAAHSRSICKCIALEHTSNTTKIENSPKKSYLIQRC